MKKARIKGNGGIFIVIGIIILILLFSVIGDKDITFMKDNTLKILSSYENKDLEDYVTKYAKKQKIDLSFEYMGDLDIVEELNYNKDNYDAVWISNSIWLYMLDNPYSISESKSISISPVVLGIKKNKAKELDLIDKEIYNDDILNLIQDKKIKYVMSSVTKTNTGATAYLGFLNSLAGSPEVLTEDMLKDQTLIDNMIDIFSGVERVSGDERFLEEMFIKQNDYEAILSSESSLININKKLDEKEQLYMIYPKDGVAINDSTFAYIDNGKDNKEDFLDIQKYLLSKEGQKELNKLGRRTWYGGINSNVDKNIFNKKWGIDTNKYLVTTKYPSKKIMNMALNLYIEILRKPTHVVFCLDHSGSMYGNGIKELNDAMSYILDYDKASVDRLQFSDFDKISVITFSSSVNNIYNSYGGHHSMELIDNLSYQVPNGATALYDAIEVGFDILEEESEGYTKTIIAMTDGDINVGSFNQIQNRYYYLKEKIPVYSISFGDANISELEEIARLTNAKVFDGRINLKGAFKEVRGYN